MSNAGRSSIQQANMDDCYKEFTAWRDPGFATIAWWCHQMETFSALLALCAGNSPVTGEFPAQRPVTRSFDVFFDLRLNPQLSKQWRRWWFATLPRLLWRHCNGCNTCEILLLPDNQQLQQVVGFVKHLSADFLLGNIIALSLISRHWDATGGCKRCARKTRSISPHSQ